MRALTVLILAAVVAVSGCGEEDDPRPVTLTVLAPADAAVVRDAEVEVRGRVRPADAKVVVLGREATVSGGEFHARVPLDEGSNVIDVGASAADRASAFRVLRVGRQVVIEVPDVTGDSRDDAVDRLQEAGLHPDVDEESGLLDRFLPARWSVCETDPEPGAEVSKGARVIVRVSRAC